MTPFDGPHDVVDRESELRQACALIDEALSHNAAAVVRFAGPAGVGKTTFLRYVLAARPSLGRTLWAILTTAERMRPAACVRALLGSFDDSEPPEDVLRDALDAALDGGATVAIDDAQWIDEISERVLRAAIRTCRSPLVVLFTDRRENAADLPPHRTVRMRPLRASAATRLVRRLYPHAAADVVAEIVTAASGLPFSIEFLAAASADRAAVSREDVDPSLFAAITSRLDRCSDRAREVARHCAFLQPPADLRVVARAMRMTVDDTAGALTELLDLIVVVELQAVFRHALIGDGIAASAANAVPYYRRLLDAHSIADDRVETLASAMSCARGCGDDAVTAASALRLGRIFAASGSLITSLDHLRIALRHAPRPLPAEYALEYASTLQQLARDDNAAEFLEAELRGAIARNDARSIAELMTSYGSVALTLERFAEFEALLDRVDPIVAAHEPQACRMLRTARVGSLVFAGRLAEADRVAGSFELRWTDRRALAFSAALRGDVDAARDLFDAYHAGLDLEHQRFARGDRALSATIRMYATGNSALRGIDEGWGDERDPGTYATGTALRILQRVNDGRWLEIDAIVAQLRLDDPNVDEPYAILDARLMFSGIARRPPAAPERALRSIRRMIAQGRPRHAVAAASWYWIGCSHGNEPVPPDIADFVKQHLGIQPMPYLVGGIPVAVSLLAPYVGAEESARALAARDVFRSRWHRAHADLAAGVLSVDHAVLRRAREAFDALDTPVFAMLAGLALPIPRASDVALARVLGLAPDPANRDTKRTSNLTKRERDVCELAAQGLSNREIAAQAGIKERTVEAHLTNVFRKIGVRSRSGLAHALLRPIERKP